MTDLAHARGDDRLALLNAELDTDALLGRWVNADQATRGISEMTCTLRDGQLRVRVTGVGPDGPIDWGEVPATTYSDISATGGARVVPCFLAIYDHGFLRAQMLTRLNLGLLVSDIFNEFTDDSGRSSYLNREVFVRTGRE